MGTNTSATTGVTGNGAHTGVGTNTLGGRAAVAPGGTGVNGSSTPFSLSLASYLTHLPLPLLLLPLLSHQMYSGHRLGADRVLIHL